MENELMYRYCVEVRSPVPADCVPADCVPADCVCQLRVCQPPARQASGVGPASRGSSGRPTLPGVPVLTHNKLRMGPTQYVTIINPGFSRRFIYPVLLWSPQNQQRQPRCSFSHAASAMLPALIRPLPRRWTSLVVLYLSRPWGVSYSTSLVSRRSRLGTRVSSTRTRPLQ